MRLRTSALLWAALTILTAVPTIAQELPSQALSLLQRRCLQCHNESTAMSGLQMLTREQLLKGGTRGPAIKPGDASGKLVVSGRIALGKAGHASDRQAERR